MQLFLSLGTESEGTTPVLYVIVCFVIMYQFFHGDMMSILFHYLLYFIIVLYTQCITPLIGVLCVFSLSFTMGRRSKERAVCGMTLMAIRAT